MSHGLTIPVAQLPTSDEELALFLVLVLAVFFFANYVAGRMYNVSRSRRVAAIAKGALSDLDPSPHLRWSTKSIVLAGTTTGKSIAEYRFTLLLMGKENLINWGIARLSGRSDMGIFAANLPRKPRIQFDVIRKDTPPHSALRKAPNAVEYNDVGDQAVREIVGGRSTIAGLVAQISKHPRIWTFSVREDTPELVVNLTLQGITEGEARDILQTILLVSARTTEA
jgi:hypothetical protein